jgi:hypothetical protein
MHKPVHSLVTTVITLLVALLLGVLLGVVLLLQQGGERQPTTSSCWHPPMSVGAPCTTDMLAAFKTGA